MPTRILVPLDGSPFSEQVLPAVQHFTTAVGEAAVELFYVIDPAEPADVIPTAASPDYFNRAQQLASAYLEEQRRALSAPGVEVSTRVGIGPPARAILDHLERGGFDYVFMATRGRSGLARTVLGSVTDRVIRESPVPVVAVHPLPASAAHEPWVGEDATTPALIDLLARGDRLSAQAAEVLTKRGAAVVPELVQALKGGAPEARQYAARILGRIGDQSALADLLDRLSDDVWEVRWEAEEAVARFGEPGVEAALHVAATAPADQRRNQALAHILERAPFELMPTVKPVIAALLSSESAVTAPIAAAKALERMAKRRSAVA